VSAVETELRTGVSDERAWDAVAGGTWRGPLRVEADGGAYPNRLAEWNSYLLYLRAYADAAGVLPPALDTLVRDVFEPLLG